MDATLPPRDPFLWRYERAVMVSANAPAEQQEAERERAKAYVLRDIRHFCACTDDEIAERFEFVWEDFRPYSYSDRDTGEVIASKDFLRGTFEALPKQPKGE